MVTNQQLYIAVGVPMLFNVVLVSVVVAHFNSRLDDLRHHLDQRIDDLRAELHRRLDDLRDLWRAELHRVEGVIDARLSHLEQQR